MPSALPRPRVAPKNHKPSGKPGWPRIILSGEYDTRKSWQSALLSADERIPDMFWLEIGDGEVTAEEYGAIPGVNYTIIDWDGTWSDMDEQLEAHWHLAKEAEANGDGPIPLVVDAVSGEWAMLKMFGDLRARQRHAKKLERAKANPKKAFDADYDPVITGDLWGIIDTRHNRWMSWVLTWPGPVVLIARDKYVTVFENGEPTKEKVWSLQAKPGLEFVATAWVRLHKTEKAEVLKLKSVRNGVQLAVDPAKARGDFSLATLIFDWIGCDAASRAPTYRTLDPDQDMPGEAPAPPAAAPAAGTETTEKARARLGRWVAWLLAVANTDDASNRERNARAHPSGDVDVLDMLDDDVRERLGIPPSRETVTFAQLGSLVAGYVGRHKRSPLAPLDDEPEPAAETRAETAA